MPRIAYISSTFPDFQKCGSGIYAGYLCRALAQQGHDVHVITSAVPEIRPTFGKVTVHKIMESWNPTELPKLIQAFMQIQPEIIHINHPTAIAGQKSKILVNMIPEINRHLWKLPTVTTLHEFPNVSLLGKVKLLPFLLLSDALTVTNSRYAAAVRDYLPAPHHNKINIVNIGSGFKGDLPEADTFEQRRHWGLEAHDKVLGFAGFITPSKGFHNLIEAAAPLMREDPTIKLLALSSWNLATSAYRQKILDRIRREGIGSQVIFTGFLEDEDLWSALSAIDVVVFPFDRPVEDRSSGPLRQVLFRGMPTIAYADDIHYEEFGMKHGENIWFTPFRDLPALRTSILKLLKDQNLREKISEGAKALRPQLNYDAISNDMSRIYSKLLSR